MLDHSIVGIRSRFDQCINGAHVDLSECSSGLPAHRCVLLPDKGGELVDSLSVPGHAGASGRRNTNAKIGIIQCGSNRFTRGW